MFVARAARNRRTAKFPGRATEYWIGLRNPYHPRWVPPTGEPIYRRIRALLRPGCETRTHESSTKASVCVRGSDDGFDCGVIAGVPEAICAAGAAYEKRDRARAILSRGGSEMPGMPYAPEGGRGAR